MFRMKESLVPPHPSILPSNHHLSTLDILDKYIYMYSETLNNEYIVRIYQMSS